MYYADLFVRGAGLPVQDSTRLAHLESLVARYLASPGNARYSAEQISRVAYNAEPGALGDYSASVHLVGELLGTVLDLVIRDATANRRSMDDVMRLMLVRFSGERGFTGRDVERAVGDVCGCAAAAREIFAAHVRRAAPIDFDRWLRLAGLRATVSRAPVLGNDGRPAADLRVRGWQPREGAPLRLIVTTPTSVWGRAGLHTRDELVSINGTRIGSWPEMRALLAAAHVGDTLRFEVMRPSGRAHRTVVLSGYDRPVVRVGPTPEATSRQRAVLAGWLARGKSQE